MAPPKKPMSDMEKKAKLSVLKDAHKAASDKMKEDLSHCKDPKELKKHVAKMSEDTQHDFKNDSDSIVDPQREGRVMGRQISFENKDRSMDDQSVYDPEDLSSIEQRLQELMDMKKRKA